MSYYNSASNAGVVGTGASGQIAVYGAGNSIAGDALLTDTVISSPPVPTLTYSGSGGVVVSAGPLTVSGNLTISAGQALVVGLPTAAMFPLNNVNQNLFLDGSVAGFIEDFYSCVPTTVSATLANPVCDTGWDSAPITGGTTGTIQADSTNSRQNPGTAIFTTTAVSGQGISLFKGDGANGMAPLGILGGFAGWQMDIWFKIPATITNYCFRVGYCVSGQQAVDPPTGGTWFEYDTANGSSNSTIEFRTVNASTPTYTNTTITPTASHFYHVRIYSVTAGTLVWQIGDNNGALSAASAGVTSNVDTTHACMPFIQLIPRTTAAVTLIVDRYAFTELTGRV